MRVFIAGATGAVGRRLVPLALRAGHQVNLAPIMNGVVSRKAPASSGAA
jgi:nucleoside-diphosphate-sugar epimerase